MESRVELFEQFRRGARVDGLTVRAPAARQGVSQRLEPLKTATDAMLLEDTTAPRKQRQAAAGLLPDSCGHRQAQPVRAGPWTRTFTDHRLCVAIVDRLAFSGTIIETGTASYRLAHTLAHQSTT